MQHNPQKFLLDIDESIKSIETFLSEIEGFTDYQSNKIVRRAVEREFGIIGEALNRLLKMNPEIPISSARRIIDFRNWVIHG